MADNSILTPGYLTSEDSPAMPENELKCLQTDNYLSEYETEEQKSVVRENLNVPSKDSVYTKQDTDIQVSLGIREAIQEYLNLDDPHGILPTVEQMIEGMVKQDGSTPFNLPLGGVDPIADDHLTTKKFVTRLIRDHLNSEDPHSILPEVLALLQSYVKLLDVYLKSQVYTKEESDKLDKLFVKRDGTTPFTKALIGVDPHIDSHLATKRYVDKTLYQHLIDVDPHGFLTILNLKLALYIKKKDVYDKTQTYSRTQIDYIVEKLVSDSIDQSIQNYIDGINDKFEYIRKLRYVKLDGSVPFIAPQLGIPAINNNELATLGLITDSVKEVIDVLSNKIDKKECIWKTSGPVEATVGQLEINTSVPDTMNLQEVCDAIFYGKGVCLEIPEFVTITERVPVTLCVHGSIGLIEKAELFQNGNLIYSFERDAFDEGCITVNSMPLYEDAEFVFKVTYTNGIEHEDTKTVNCYLPIFVGLLPKWKFGNTITMDYLIQLCNEDSAGTQNRFVSYGKDLKSITFKYKFLDKNLRHPFIVVPESYPDLDNITIKSLGFTIGAFEVINRIPLSVPGVEDDIIFKIYIYKQALSNLNQEVTFNFTSE